jgi:hypothetical protein
MTSKEKALELWWKYYSRIEHTLSEEYSPHEKFITKQCCLIAVDEIIESRKDDGAFDDTKWGNSSEYYTPHPMYLNYWNLVKTEIEKL